MLNQRSDEQLLDRTVQLQPLSTPTRPGSERTAMERIQLLASRHENAAKTMIGYPQNLNPPAQYSDIERLFPGLRNNYGDAHAAHGNYAMHTHDLERTLVDKVAELAGLESSDAWGYVESGSTGANIHAVGIARYVQPDAILISSSDAHESSAKAAKGIDARIIKSLPSGAMSLDELQQTLKQERRRRVVVLATVGTTFKGAVDDVGKIKDLLETTHRGRHYLHVDAALLGWPYLFVSAPTTWNFTAGADSICISGHKYPGLSRTSSLFLVRRQYVEASAPDREVQYVGSRSTTLAGSRDGIAVAQLYFAAHLRSYWSSAAEHGLQLAKEFQGTLASRGIDAHCNERSLIVWFPEPPPPVTTRWQLATESGIAHAIMMPHVHEGIVKEFLHDVEAWHS